MRNLQQEKFLVFLRESRVDRRIKKRRKKKSIWDIKQTSTYFESIMRFFTEHFFVVHSFSDVSEERKKKVQDFLREKWVTVWRKKKKWK
jgi:hypothetical protein